MIHYILGLWSKDSRFKKNILRTKRQHTKYDNSLLLYTFNYK